MTKEGMNKNIAALLATLPGVAGLFALTRQTGDLAVGAGSFFSLLPALFVFFLYRKILGERSLSERKNIRKNVFAVVFSFFFALSFFLGYQMRQYGMTASGFAGKIGILANGFLLSFIFFPFFYMIFSFVDPANNTPGQAGEPSEKNGKRQKEFSVKSSFFLSFAIIFISWIPVFLAYYPGIMSYDSNRQFSEGYLGIFWELQPILHTLLIRWALLLGEAVRSYEFGVACYSILQMLTLSAALAYSLSFVYERIRKLWIVIALSLFFGNFPVFSVLALCVTKDIFFTAFFLTLSVLCIKRYLKTPKNPLLYDIAMIVCGIFMTLFRKNGIYGFVFFAILYVIAMKKERIRILIVCALLIVLGIGSVFALRFAVHGARGPKTEMYSVPIQQMGHIAFFHRGELSEEEKATMEKYLAGSTTEWQSFNISLADSQKSSAVEDAWVNTPQMLKDWIYFGVRYPNDYIDAYLGLTAGYWFTDDIAISQYLGYGRESERGLIETFNASKPIGEEYPGVQSVSKLPRYHYFLEGFVSDEWYLKIPVLSVLFRPACYVWASLVFFGIILYKKRYRDFAAASLQLMYFGTVLLGPVANIRYVFPLMTFLPVLVSFALTSREETQEDSKDRKEPVKAQGKAQAE